VKQVKSDSGYALVFQTISLPRTVVRFRIDEAVFVQVFSLLFFLDISNNKLSYVVLQYRFSDFILQLGCEADHSIPTSAKVKNTWIYTSDPHMSSWCSA
jgi:hypothetical protein